MTDANYAELADRIAALTEGEDDVVSLMATVVCELHHSDDRFDWTGFYRVTAPGLLKIGPYQGGHGCLTIPFDRGVCGAAARTGQDQAGPQRPFRRDRGPTFPGVETVELGIRAGQRIVDDPTDLPQRVPRGDAFLGSTQLNSDRLVRPAHHRPQLPAEVNHVPQTGSSGEFFSALFS